MNILKLSKETEYNIYADYLNNMYKGIMYGYIPNYKEVTKMVNLLIDFEPKEITTYQYFNNYISLKNALVICRKSNCNDKYYLQLLNFAESLNRFNNGICSEIIRGYNYFSMPERILTYFKSMDFFKVEIRKFDYENGINYF